MITLPQILLSNAADGAAGGDAKGTDGKGVGADFLELFSKALPGKVTLEDGKTLPLSAALSKVLGKDSVQGDGKESQAALSELLSNPGQPEALSSLLASVSKTDAKDKLDLTAKDDGTDKPLSNADLQALSALFAMLPQPVTTASAAALSKTDAETTPLSGPISPQGAGAKSSTESLLSTSGSAKKAPATAATLAESKASTAPASAPGQQHVDDKIQLAANSDSRDNASPHANNTAPVTAQITPAISSATVAAPTTTHIATPTAPMISSQLGSHEWQQQISQHVTLFTKQGQHSAELRLHPEDLGQVQISLKLEDNQAQLQMMSPHSHVRAALEAALPTLRTALAESGIQLGQSNISSESFAQQQSGQQQQQQTARSAERFSLNGDDAQALPVAESLQRLASNNGAVDIFA